MSNKKALRKEMKELKNKICGLEKEERKLENKIKEIKNKKFSIKCEINSIKSILENHCTFNCRYDIRTEVDRYEYDYTCTKYNKRIYHNDDNKLIKCKECIEEENKDV
jgi:chromosome segregation ATPase